MGEFVELGRRFLPISGTEDSEESAAESYLHAELTGKRRGQSWDDLIGSGETVVILGEPGSGKTSELEAAAERLRRNGYSTAFIELGQMVHASAPVLDASGSGSIENWRRGDGTAWLFLDAVDESKLTRAADFRTALRRISQWVGDQRHRVKYVISSRISEWKHDADSELVAIELLPHSRPPADGHVPRSPRKVHVVKLLPLDRDQLTSLVGEGVSAKAFIAAVEEADALEFVGRPSDAKDLYALWSARGRLGTKTEILEQATDLKLRQDEDRSGVSLARIRSGAELLCACLTLTKHVSISLTDDLDESGNSLPFRQCLPNSWSDHERRSLIQRALFDGSAFGRVRVHHRTHQEYLAACWLRNLMEKECPYSELRQIAFEEISSSKLVLRPHLENAIAWLATISPPTSWWTKRLFADLSTHAPWAFLAHGDPQAIDPDLRRTV